MRKSETQTQTTATCDHCHTGPRQLELADERVVCLDCYEAGVPTL